MPEDEKKPHEERIELPPAQTIAPPDELACQQLHHEIRAVYHRTYHFIRNVLTVRVNALRGERLGEEIYDARSAERTAALIHKHRAVLNVASSGSITKPAF